jgi:hypothetical protein
VRRIALVILSVLALLLVATGAGARPNSSGGPGRHVEQRIFIDYAKGAAGKPSADASSTDFHLLAGHPSWSTPTTVHYSVDTTGCSPDCANAVSAVDAAFNAWEFSGITFTRSTQGDSDPCGGTDSVTWGPIDGKGGILAQTAVCRSLSGHEIVGFTTLFDSGDPWSDSGNAGSFDIQATATHEEGHTTGLDHARAPFDARLTMYPYIGTADIGFRTLGCGDLLGISSLYGATVDCSTVPLD